MKAIVLAAGQGRRLLPWTHDLPKCLLTFAGKPLIAWQLEALSQAGVEEAVVVTGFGSAAIDQALAKLAPPRMAIRTVFNPFYSVADNIASCWLVRDEFKGEFILLNGDVLFPPEAIAKVRSHATRPVTVTIDEKSAYDADDMKVELDGDRLVRIGKQLPASSTHGESIGLILVRGVGGPQLAEAVDAVIRTPAGVTRWYLSAIDELATRSMVGVVSIAGMGWTEIDYPADLARAEDLARGWSGVG